MKTGWGRFTTFVLLLVWTASVLVPRLFLYQCSRTGQQAFAWHSASGTHCGACEVLTGSCAISSARGSSGCCTSKTGETPCHSASCNVEPTGNTSCSCCQTKVLEWETDYTTPSDQFHQVAVLGISALTVQLPRFHEPNDRHGFAAWQVCPPPLPLLSLVYFGCQRC